MGKIRFKKLLLLCSLIISFPQIILAEYLQTSENNNQVEAGLGSNSAKGPHSKKSKGKDGSSGSGSMGKIGKPKPSDTKPVGSGPATGPNHKVGEGDDSSADTGSMNKLGKGRPSETGPVGFGSSKSTHKYVGEGQDIHEQLAKQAAVAGTEQGSNKVVVKEAREEVSLFAKQPDLGGKPDYGSKGNAKEHADKAKEELLAEGDNDENPAEEPIEEPVEEVKADPCANPNSGMLKANGGIGGEPTGTTCLKQSSSTSNKPQETTKGELSASGASIW